MSKPKEKPYGPALEKLRAEKTKVLSRATNLFQAALAGPLNDTSRADVEQLLEECLEELTASFSSRATVAV